MSHIQKIAPGPPAAMAVATPAKFPVPTREAVLIVKAWNEEIPFFPSLKWLVYQLKPETFLLNM